jgi:hypothetical protein
MGRFSDLAFSVSLLRPGMIHAAPRRKVLNRPLRPTIATYLTKTFKWLLRQWPTLDAPKAAIRLEQSRPFRAAAHHPWVPVDVSKASNVESKTLISFGAP